MARRHILPLLALLFGAAPALGDEPLPPPQRLPDAMPGPPAPPELPSPAPAVPSPPPLPPPGGLTVDGVAIDPLSLGGGFLNPAPLGGGCSSCGEVGCGGGTACVPGRKSCAPLDGGTVVSRFAGAVYNIVCCPDPCYSPRWTTLANAAYFVDGARPVTQSRLRYDGGLDLRTPDRAEFFWPRADGKGLGPAPRPNFRGETGVDYHELRMCTEAHTGRISVITDMGYRTQVGETTTPGSGFTDMTFGTKTLMVDSELFQASLQFLTTVPTGNFRKGLGTALVSLEPSLIFGLQVSPGSFFQAQVAQRIPLGGDPGYAGGVLHYHLAYNAVLAAPVQDLKVIGTLEFNGWTFQNGSYSDPIRGPLSARGTYLSAGPGVRVSFCDKLDFGVGSAFALTDPHWAAALVRAEFRFRY